MFKRIAVPAIAIAAFGVVISGVGRAQDAPPQGDAAHGKQIFLSDQCFTCHGRAGEGGAYNTPAPILAHTALPFEAFKGQLRNPANDMPAFSAVILSDQDVADIYAFVQSLPGAGSPKDHPILSN